MSPHPHVALSVRVRGGDAAGVKVLGDRVSQLAVGDASEDLGHYEGLAAVHTGTWSAMEESV